MKKELRDVHGKSEKEYLADNQPRHYEKPSVSVDIVIISDTNPQKVLLIQRKNHPFIEQWALPGGFVNIDEDIDSAAYRELKEETHVEALSLKQLHTYGALHRDPRMRVISIAYVAVVQQPLKTCADDDAKEALWFNLELHAHRIELYNHEHDVHIAYTITQNGIHRIDGYDAFAFDHIQILLDGLKMVRK